MGGFYSGVNSEVSRALNSGVNSEASSEVKTVGDQESAGINYKLGHIPLVAFG